MKKLLLAFFGLLLINSLKAQTYIHPTTGQQIFNGVSTGTYYDNGGVGSNYSDNINSSSTKFFSPNNATTAEKFKFSFSQFQTEANYDSLSIYDGGDSLAPFCAKFSGTQTAFDIYSTEGVMSFYFKSDNATFSAGWTATVSTLNAGISSGPSSITKGQNYSWTFNGTNTNFSGGTPIIKLVGPATYTLNAPTVQSAVAMSVDGALPCSAPDGNYHFEIHGFGQGKFILPTTIVVSGMNVSLTTTNVSCFGGSDGNITSSISGGISGYTYSWHFGPTTANVSGLAAGTYSLSVTDAVGCLIMESATITQPSLLSGSITGATDICMGGFASFSTSAAGGAGAYTYSWIPSTGLSSTNISNPTATPSISTTYTCKITDSNGCTLDVTKVLTVNTLPTINAGADMQVCHGATSSISASATGAIVYNWSPSTNLSSSTILSPSFTGNNFGTTPTTTVYTLTATSAQGCTSSDLVSLTSNPIPTAMVSYNGPVCENTQLEVYATSTVSGSSFAWSGPNAFSSSIAMPTVTPAALGSNAGNYFVIASANGCSSAPETLSVIVFPLPDASFSGLSSKECFNGPIKTLTPFVSGGTFIGSGVNGSDFNPYTVGIGTVSITYNVTDINGCNNSSSQSVEVVESPTVSANVDYPSICQGTQVTFYSSISGDSITSIVWDSGAITEAVPTIPSTSGFHYVTVTNTNGCFDTASVFSQVDPTPVVFNNLLATTICEGDSLFLNATGAITYNWYLPPSGLTNGVYYTPLASEEIVVRGINSFGCYDDDTVFVTVNSVPVINAGADRQLCIGSSLVINDATFSNTASLSWEPQSFFSTNYTTTPELNGISDTSIVAIAFSADGCITTDTLLLTVNPLPVISVVSNPIACSNQPTTVEVSGASSYSWTPDAGMFPSGFVANPTITLATSSTFTVYGQSAEGCMNNMEVMISVNPMPIVDAGIDQTICDTVALMNASPVGGTWSITSGPGGNAVDWMSPTTLFTGMTWGTNSILRYSFDDGVCPIVYDELTVINTQTSIVGVVFDMGSPVAGGQIKLYAKRSQQAAYPLIDVINIQPDGTYSFYKLAADTFMVEAIADLNNYPLTVPTFSGDVHRWELSASDILGCGVNASRDVNLVNKPAATGGGSNTEIDGRIIDVSDTTGQRKPGEPVRGAGVALEQIPGGSLKMSTTTDSTGSYSFVGVPNGNYQVYVTVPGLSHVSTYEISVNPTTGDYSEKNFFIDSLEGYIDTTSTFSFGTCGFVANFWAASGCLGSELTIANTSVVPDANAVNYNWDFNSDGVVDDNTKGTPQYTFVSANSYQIRLIINDLGNTCSDTVENIITIYDYPEIVFDINYDTLCSNGGSIIVFDAQPAGGTYTGIGIVNDSFDPNGAATGLYFIDYTYGINGCQSTKSDNFTVEICSDILELTKNIISIMPNPAQNSLEVSFDQPSSGTLTLIDNTGRLIFQEELKDVSNKRIDLENISSGIYFVKFSNHTDLQTIKLVKE